MDMMLEQFKTIFDRPEKVKKLRETILDLAVRGKLVPQDHNDEPASVLLERIKKERDSLLKSKIISKPKIAVIDYKKELEIPNNWGGLVLSDICYLCEGRKFEGKELPYLEVKYLRGKIEPNIRSQGKYVDRDTYLLLMDGENSGEVFITTEDGYLGSTFKILIINNNLNKQYINYLLLSYKEMFKKSKKGAAIPHLDRNLFNNLPIGIPPIEEQGRIVEKIDSLMSFCDKLEKALEKKVNYGELSAKSVFNSVGNVSTVEELEETLKFILLNFKDLSLGDNAVKELKNCILQLAVQGKLVLQDPNDEPAEVLLGKIREEKERLIKEKKIKREKSLPEISEEEKPFELPDGWKWTRFTEIGELSRGKSKHRPRNDFKLFENGKYPLVQTGDVARANCIITKYNCMYSEFGLSQSRLWNKGTLCITIAANIADSAILGFDSCFPDSVVGFVPYKPINIELNKFFYYIINIMKKDLEKFAPSTAQKNINLSILTNLIIPLPPLEEQKRIVEKVDSLMVLCDKLEKKIEKQKEYSSRLMEVVIKNI